MDGGPPTGETRIRGDAWRATGESMDRADRDDRVLSAAAPPRGTRRRRAFIGRLPIAAVLVGGFGGLVLLAVAAVLALGLSSGGRNTFSLLNDNAELVLSNVELRLRQRLETAERAAAYIAELAESGAFDQADAQAHEDALRAVLALAPDVTNIAYLREDGSGVRLRRGDAAARAEAGRSRNAGEAPGSAVAAWGAPSWATDLRTSLVEATRVARRDGRPAGHAAVAVSLGDLSRFLLQLYADLGVNAFVLYDREHVLAHPSLAARAFTPEREGGPPLPRITQVDDPALAALWSVGGETLDDPGGGIIRRRVAAAGEERLFLLRAMGGVGPQNWMVGVWMPEREAGREVRRLTMAAGAGFAILLTSVAAALYVGRRISRSISSFAAAADRVRSLDFADLRPMPSSRMAEIDRAAAAFNAMLAGLRWFEAYVPKALVLRLMKRGLIEGGLRSEEREVTVMFTDIRDFSALAQSMTPAETQALLTRHFSLLAGCIEEEGGTVDKFIGDAVMAFWGAPDEQPDHAARALRAAAAIGRAVAAANHAALAEGRRPVFVRVAVHSGRVVVGNIGSAVRVNYTIIGDPVNVAARLEELARSLHEKDEDACVLASDAAAQAAAAGAGAGAGAEAADLPPMTSLGLKRLRGRSELTRVWKIILSPRSGR